MGLKKPTGEKATTTKSTAPPKRTTRRVEDTEANRGSVRKTAAHRGAAVMELVEGAGIRFVGQGSELVPVAQYASVTIGPILIDAIIPYDASALSILAEIDWPNTVEEMAEMDWPSDEHRQLFEQMVNQAVGIQRIVDVAIGRDRALVEESIRLYNEREEEESKAGKGKGR